jgi:hypothetical protein
MFLLVIVNDLNVEGVSALPAEADSILLVDTYAVLAFPVSLQLFQSVRRGAFYILEGD